MAKDITVVLTLDNKQFRSALQKSEKDVSGFASSTTSQLKGIGVALTAAVGALGVRELVNYTNTWTDLNSRLRQATGSTEAAKRTLEAISATARRTYTSLEQTAEVFLRNSNTLTELGFSTQKQIEFTDALNNALVISGARGQEAESVQMALNRAFALGTLSGENFNSVLRNGSRLTKALADGFGVTTIELQNMARKGLLTTTRVMAALSSQMSTLSSEAEAMEATIGDAFVILGDAVLKFIGSSDTALGASQSFAEVIIKLADEIEKLATSIESLGDGAAKLKTIVIGLGTALIFLINPIGKITAGVGLLSRGIAGLFKNGTSLGNLIHQLRNNFSNFSGVVKSLAKDFFGFGSSVVKSSPALTKMAEATGTLFKGITAVGSAVLGYLGLSSLFNDELEESTQQVDGFTEALAEIERQQAEAAAQTLLLAEAAKKLDDVFESLLKDFDSGKFNTALENAQIRLNKARDASFALSVRIAELDEGSENYAETLAHLLRIQQAVNAEIEQSTNVISDLHNQYKQVVDDVREGISLDFGLKELETQLAEFDLSEVDREVNQFFRDIEASFAKNQESLEELLSDRDLPEAYRAQLQELLDQLPALTEEAKKRGEELIRALADKESLREQTQEFNDALRELGNIESPDGLDAFILRIEELARVGKITTQQFAILKQAALDLEASLGAGAGIGKALQEIGKQFTPFQMAVDATTMAWRHMSNAIDQFVETGKASFSDLAKSILRDLAKMILKQMLYNTLVGAIKGGAAAFGFTIPGLADGGTAQKNKPYIVGEEGPELFVPGATGTVIPNDKLGGGMRGQVSAPVTNNYITNNINALDSRSVAQVFAENRQTLLGTVEYARKETAYGV